MAAKTRIARLVPALDFGGVETRVALQSELHDREKFDLHVVTLHADGRAAARVRAAGVAVHVLDVSPSIREPRTTLVLTRTLRRLRPHILHASAGEGMFHGALAGNLAAVPRIILEEVGMPGRGRAGRLTFAALYRTVDAVVSVSGAVQDLLVRTEWLPLDRARMIHNCAQPVFFEPVRRTWSAEGRPFRFFTAGRLVPQKNLAFLLSAFAELVTNEGVDAELVIAGDGPLAAELREKARNLGLDQRVHFLGFRSDIPALLDEHDAFVFPAGYGEGCSNALVEAMARATPLISSSSPGNPEVAGELGDDWVLSHTDGPAWTRAMARLARMDPVARQAHGTAGRAIAEARFSPTRYLGDVEAMYLDVLARPSRRVAAWLDRA